MRNIFLVVVMLGILLGVQPLHADEQKLLNVVCTIGQITDVARNIAGNRMNVLGLMGAGVDPHLYKASESDVRKLSEAHMILYNGINLEAKMTDIFKKMGGTKKIVAVGEAISNVQLLDSIQYQGHFDPHIWFDVHLWITVTETIRDALTDLDPDGRELYTANAAAYISQLKDLDTYIINKTEELLPNQRVLVTAHDAFRYFGRRYKFEVVGLQGISTESAAGVKDVVNLADFIAKRKIKAIFVESSVPERNIKAVQAAVQAKGWDVAIGGELFSDALGSEGTREGTYIGMVTHNINTIVNALKLNGE